MSAVCELYKDRNEQTENTAFRDSRTSWTDLFGEITCVGMNRIDPKEDMMSIVMKRMADFYTTALLFTSVEGLF